MPASLQIEATRKPGDRPASHEPVRGGRVSGRSPTLRVAGTQLQRHAGEHGGVHAVSRIVRSVASLPALLSLPLSAAEPPLGNTIVTATRTETVVDEVLAPVIVITREELERSLAPDVASLLQFHAGIDI